MTLRFARQYFSLSAFLLVLLMPAWQGAFCAEQAPPSTDKKIPLINQPSATSVKSVVVKGFVLTGNTLLPERELQLLLAGYINQSCDLNQLREAAGKVTEEYHRRGYPLARAYMLVQTITDGMVTITVMEGRIGQILIEGNQQYSADFIRNWLTSGQKEEELTVERIEHGLLLLNATFSDLKVSANFVAGRQPGTADLKVKVEESFPLHFTLTSNNFGSDFVSRYRFGGQLDWSNALMAGSTLTAGGFTGDKPANMHLINAAYSFPLNSVGTMMGLSALKGNFEVGKEFADLGIRNEERSGDVFVKHPLLLNRKSSLSAKVGFRLSDAKYFQLDEVSGRDNTRVLYAELQGDMLSLGGKSIANITLSKGLGSLLDGTESGDVMASRQNAGNDFLRANLSLARVQPVTPIFSTILTLSGQLSNTNLLAGEEWLLGGTNSVHGYASGEVSGDEGYSATLALRANPLTNKEMLQLSAFLDYGFAHKKSPLSGVKADTELTGIGLGISSRLQTVAPTNLRIDIGWPISPSTNSQGHVPVISFDTSIRF